MVAEEVEALEEVAGDARGVVPWDEGDAPGWGVPCLLHPNSAPNRSAAPRAIPRERGFMASVHARRGDPEVTPHVGHDLRVGRVVGRLDADDLGRERVGMLLHVVEELALRGRRPQHENLVRRGERLCDLCEEMMCVLRMGVRLGRAFRVTVEVMRGGAEPRLVEAVEVDVEDAGLVVVEPDGGAGRGGHGGGG